MITSKCKSTKCKSATTNQIHKQPKKLAGFTQYKPRRNAYEFTHNGEDRRFYIPSEVADLFNEEFDYNVVSNWKELTEMAVAICVGLIGGDEIAVTGGGVEPRATFLGEIRMRITLIGHVVAHVWQATS